MPSKIFMARDQCHHGLHPVRMIEACSSALQGLFNVVESIPALQGVASMAHGAAHRLQLSAGNALPGWQVVRGPGHLGGLTQAPGYFFRFFLQHFLILLSKCGELVACRFVVHACGFLVSGGLALEAFGH